QLNLEPYSGGKSQTGCRLISPPTLIRKGLPSGSPFFVLVFVPGHHPRHARQQTGLFKQAPLKSPWIAPRMNIFKWRKYQ
ncbi:MAG: hypothetical protein O2910_08805, partial [Proteobacteria bacterium]|nr:hypothetical protein [Pseudomonadota bacterium]